MVVLVWRYRGSILERGGEKIKGLRCYFFCGRGEKEVNE
jgi:hypothetical protein